MTFSRVAVSKQIPELAGLKAIAFFTLYRNRFFSVSKQIPELAGLKVSEYNVN